MDYDFHEVSKTLDLENIRDVRNLRAGKLERHRVKNELLHKGVLIMEVKSQQKPSRIVKNSEKGKLVTVKRRFLVLGHVTSDSDKMVSLQIKNGTSWVSFGLQYPEVAWCNGLAVVHTGETPTSEATNRYRMEQATELMMYVSNKANKDVEWQDLDLTAIKAKIDSFQPYLEPMSCSKNTSGSQTSGSSANIFQFRSASSTSSNPPSTKINFPRDTAIDEETPEFDIRRLPGLDASEIDEAEDIFEDVDSYRVNKVTSAQWNRLAELLSRAYPGKIPANKVFSTENLAFWIYYRLSDAYDHTITFSDYSNFKLWWKAVDRNGQGGTPPNHSLLDMQASGNAHRTTGGKTITPALQRLIDDEHRDHHFSDTAYDHDEQEEQEQSSPDLSTATNGGETDSQTSHNRRKRTYGVAFNASTREPSPVMDEPSSSKRSAVNSKEPWEKILTDMRTLVRVYHEFATVTFKSVESKLHGFPMFDMAALIKPTSYPGCVQRLKTGFSEEACRECLDDALDAIDYEIADELCNAVRVLGAHGRETADACDEGPLPDKAQKKRAGKKYLDEARKYLLKLKQMTEGDAMVKKIMAQLIPDPDAMYLQLVQLAHANEDWKPVEVDMHYLKTVQAFRAIDTLKKFLTKVKPMTEALVSAFDEMEKLE